MSETKTLTIDSVEEKNGFYIAHSGNMKYATKLPGIMNFPGKTATFNVGSKQNGKYTNWYINEPLPELPASSGSNGSSADDKNKMFILSYAKDITCALINSSRLGDVTPTALVVNTMEIYSGIRDSLAAQEAEENIPFS